MGFRVHFIGLTMPALFFLFQRRPVVSWRWTTSFIRASSLTSESPISSSFPWQQSARGTSWTLHRLCPPCGEISLEPQPIFIDAAQCIDCRNVPHHPSLRPGRRLSNRFACRLPRRHTKDSQQRQDTLASTFAETTFRVFSRKAVHSK